MNDPQPISAAIGTFEQPTGKRTDLDAFAVEYARRAKIDTAIARWDLNCPPLLKASDWQHPALSRAAGQIAKVLAWEYQHRGLLLSGDTGRGKSRAMWALLRKLAESGHDIGYYTAAGWFSVLQSHVNYGRDEAAAWVGAVARRQIVFVDDLGQEAISTARQDWCASWFFQFLDQRLGNGLPLLLTTNLSADQIAGTGDKAAIRGNPLVRRLLELCEVVKF